MQRFSIENSNLQGVMVVNSFAVGDERGSFEKDFELDFFQSIGIDEPICESFITTSKKGVIRGMHFQTSHPQIKLVSCISGRIVDVIVDLRKNSNTFGQYEKFNLEGTVHKSVLVPRGFAHGFLSLEENTIVSYKCFGKYDAKSDGGIIYNDSDLEIDWTGIFIENNILESELIISDKDLNLPTMKQFLSNNNGGF